MLRRLTPRDRFEMLIAKYEPAIRQAFLDAIADITRVVQLRRIVQRLERGDIAGAIEAMNLEPAAFRALDRAISEAFEGGGISAVKNMPKIRYSDGHAAIVRFDVRRPEAEKWLRDHSSQLVTNIIDDQNVAIRQALESGLERGDNPTKTALDVVGRVDRTTGARTGGVIGLTAQQERYVDNALRELLSGDPAQLRHYLSRTRRDKRYDRTVLKAIQTGKPIDRATIDKMIQRYRDSLLKLRGDTIARTEALAALGQSNIEAYRQAIADGKIDAATVVKIWHATPDGRTRHTHRSMNAQRVGFYDKFVSPSGALLAYPCDPQAPVAETVACRCWMQIKIDHLAGLE